MPIYEYYCKPCGSKFEKLILRQGQDVLCPKCRGTEIQRLLSVCSFGSGDGAVRAASTKSCTSCTSGSCSSCGGH